MRIKIIAAVLVVIGTACLCASCGGFGASEKFEYTDADGGVALFRYSGVSTVDSLEIPDEHEGKPVVELMPYAISSADYIKTLKIGKNLRTINDWSITNCLALEKIELDTENPYFTLDEQGILYDKEKTTLILCPNSGLNRLNGKVVVPPMVEKIGVTAFYLMDGLKEIDFNEGLTEIGGYAFLKCVNLTAFTLPSTIRTIGPDAFSYCDKLSDLFLPRSLVKIGDFAFFSLSSNVSSIKFERAESELAEVSFGKNWQPNKAGSVGTLVPLEYGVKR